MKPLTKEQNALLNALKYYKEDFPINIGGIFTVNKKLLKGEIENKINELLKSSPILLTKLVFINNKAYQTVDENTTFKIDYLEKDIDIKEYYLKPFNLEKSLSRVGVLFSKDTTKIIIISSHLILDGYSYLLLSNNFIKIFKEEEPFKFDDLSHVLNLEEEYLNSNRYLVDKRFWEDYLKGYNSPVKPYYNSKKISKALIVEDQINSGLTTLINNYLKDNNKTIQDLIISLLAVELSHVNGTKEISLGLTIHNRISKTKNVLGMLSSTLPLNIRLTNSFKELIKEVKRSSLSVYKHRKLGFEEILKTHTKKYSSDLFDCLVINHLNETFKDDNYQTEILRDNKTDLSLTINIYYDEIINNYKLVYVFKEELFNKLEAHDFIKRLNKRLLMVIKDNTDEISILKNIISVKSFKKPLKTFKIINLLDEVFIKYKNKIALISDDKKITYEDLEKEANILANYLIKEKINNKVVLIDLEDDLKKIISLIAVIKSNNSFVFSYNNSFSKEEYIKLTKASFIINDDVYHKKGNNTNNIFIRTNNHLATYPTSGTTSVIKAIKLSDEGVLNYVFQDDYFWKSLKEIETILNLASFTFDISLENIFLSLFHGKTLILSSLEKLDKINMKIDFLSTTPSIMAYLLNNNGFIENLKTLKVLVLGGEVLTNNLVNKIKENLNLKLYNSYGPTECSIAVSTKEIKEKITLGKVISNNKIVVLNKLNEVLPKGYAGNISVSGISLMIGYTDKSLDNFIYLNNEKYYLTNDLGFLDNNDELNYLSRLDSQIKRNGIRIELELIDNMLKGLKDVISAKTVYEDNLITSLVVTNKLTKEEISNYLKENLPRSFLPNNIIITKEITFNSSGKIIYKEEEIDKTLLKASNKIEEIILKTIYELLNIKAIYEDDTFNSLGGTSMEALMLVTILEEKRVYLPLTIFSSDVLIKDYFRFLTLEENEVKEELRDIKFYKTEVKKAFKNVILLGSTGFLGMHLLKELIDDQFKVTLLIREKDNLSAIKRLNNYYQFYFNEVLDLKKINVMETNITNKNLGLNESDLNNLLNNNQLIINSAGKVDFIGDYKEFNEINYNLVKELERLSKLHNITLFHISTTGMALLEKEVFNEVSYYKNNNYNNYYLSSKRKAEDYLLNKLKTNENIYILRVGNIMPRREDYKFQINKENNAIYNYVKRSHNLNNKIAFNNVDITPVSDIAKGILLLIKEPPFLSVLHLYNNNILNLNNNVKYNLNNDLTVSILKERGFEFKKITNKYLKEVINSWLKDK